MTATRLRREGGAEKGGEDQNVAHGKLQVLGLATTLVLHCYDLTATLLRGGSGVGATKYDLGAKKGPFCATCKRAPEIRASQCGNWGCCHFSLPASLTGTTCGPQSARDANGVDVERSNDRGTPIGELNFFSM